MFGLSTKEKIYKIIIYFYDIFIHEYIERVGNIIRNNDDLPQNKLEKMLEAAKIEYHQKVFEESMNYIVEKLPQTKSRLEEALKYPERLGLNKKDTNTEITPGKILIVLLYGTKKRLPKAKECSALDFVIHEKLRNELMDLDSKIGKADE